MIILIMLSSPEFAATYGQLDHNFTCFYSSLDPELVISRLDYEEITRSLLYSLAIPLPVFSLAVCYLVFAYLYIYRNNELDTHTETQDNFKPFILYRLTTYCRGQKDIYQADLTSGKQSLQTQS